MKTLYAVTFVCLSLPALADVLAPIRADEDDTAPASVPAFQSIEDQSVVDFYVDEYHMRHGTDGLDTTPGRDNDDNTGPASVPASKPIEEHSVGAAVDLNVDEYNVEPVTTPAVKPIDGAEFEGTSRDDGDAMWTIVRTVNFSVDTTTEDDGTAGVTSPAMPKIDNAPVNPGLDSLGDGESGELKLAERIGESSTEPGVWP
jgi:hypothetical protein